MKQLFLSSVLSFSLFTLVVTSAFAADLAIYSGPTNPGWISQEAAIANTEAIMNDARIKAIFENIDNYGDGDEFGYTSPLGRWMQAHTGNGQQDVFIAASGTSPSAIYQFPNIDPDGSNIEKFVEDGNVFINVADYILYMSYEGGVRSADNGGAGAANVFDIPHLSFWPPGTGVFMSPTEIGKKYLPSLKAFESHRPWNLGQFNGTDWEVIPFAVSDDRTNTADPAVAVHKRYGGIIAAMWQRGQPNWDGNDPRASGVIEFIANWLTEHGRITTPTDGRDKIPTTWEGVQSDNSGTATVSISPSQVQSPAPGEPLVFNLNITDGEDVAGYQATLQFDTTALRYISSSNADYLPAGAFVVPTLVNGNQVTLAATSLRGGSHGDGTLATLTFEVIAAKPSVLTLSEVQLTDVDADFLSVNSKNAEIVEATQLRRDNVRLIYFRPSDRPRRQGIGTHLDTLIKDVQAFYAKQMQHHQAKTFTYETHTDGTAVVHYVDGQNTDTYYQDHTFNRVRGEIQKQFDTSKHIYLVAVDLSSERVNDGTQGGVCGIGGGNWTSRDNKTWQRDSGGLAVIPASGTCFNLYVTAHELGHTFGLEHDFRDDNYLMAYGSQTRLSADAAEWLSVHPYFNALQTGANQQTAFEMLSAHASGLNFQITDANGLHQAQLLIPTAVGDPAGGSKLHQSQALNDKISTTVKFVATELIGVSSNEVTLQVIDGQGNITKQTFSVETDSVAKVADAPIGGDVATVRLPTSLPSAAVGDRLTLPITIAGGADVAGYQLDIEFDVSALRYISSANADYLPVGAFVVPALVSGNRVTLAATALSGSSDGSGTLATLVFEARTANPARPRLSDAKLTDSNADFLEVRIENTEVPEPVQLAADVNGDGIVSLEDMDAAADRLGQSGENTADVNGNGIVDAADLLLIAAAIEQGNAAPSLHSEAIVNMFTAAEVRQWLQLAWQQELTGRLYQRGFLVLEQLLAILTPEETVLLPNYPNPFNPETWIPYHLSKPASVTVSIYATDGRLVRRLWVGYQSAGIYESRSRAAYWDGRNDVGEPVASGVYFYTLTAADFAATRKLLIRK